MGTILGLLILILFGYLAYQAILFIGMVLIMLPLCIAMPWMLISAYMGSLDTADPMSYSEFMWSMIFICVFESPFIWLFLVIAKAMQGDKPANNQPGSP